MQSNIAIVETTSANTAVQSVQVGYPEGFTSENCVILSINVKVNNQYWRNEINGVTSIVSSTLKDGIEVCNGANALSAYLSKPVRVVLFKLI